MKESKMAKTSFSVPHKIFLIVTIILMIAALLISSCSQQKDNALQTKKELLAGFHNAVAYSGFRHGQHPDRGTGAVNPTDEQILEDLKILVQNPNLWLIRLYDSQDNSETVLRLIKEHDIEIKVLLGIWLKAEISNHEGCAWLTEPIPEETLAHNKQKNLAEIDDGIRLANEYPDIVVAVNVGNEALVEWHDHMVSVDTVVAYVRKVKAEIKQPVTVSDSYGWWKVGGAALADDVDFISLHSYPVWEGKDINEGLSYTIESILSIKTLFPEKMIVITEVGWATVASEFGERASEEKQKRYYAEMTQWAKQNNVTTFFFEAFDEDWKGDPNNPLGAEKHWGLFTVDRKAKLVMYELYPDLVTHK